MADINKNRSLKKFILVWMGFLVACFAIMTVTLVISTNKLQRMSDQIFTDAMALDYAHRLEIDILEQRREDLLWKLTGNELSFKQKSKELQDLENNFKELRSYVTTGKEHTIINEIERKLALFIAATTTIPQIGIERIGLMTDSLLVDVEKYRDQNRKQMAETIAASDRLDALVDRWSLVMVVLVALVVAACSIILIKRIIHPVLNLIDTSEKFGQGDFEVRAPVYRKDEIGDLCVTFNGMAADIQNHLQERRNFIAAVAHDLKNPLVVIGAAARKLNRDETSPEERNVWLNYIIQDVDHLEHLLGDLMDSVQIESGKFTLHKKELELTSFVNCIHQRQESIVKSHQLVFEGKTECWIQGDSRRIERAVLNLLSNAYKYSPEKSTILLKVEKDGQSAKLIVKDEGFGIEEDEIAKIFLPFRRASRTQGVAEGWGMGLFSVKKIVDGHGGTINILSRVGGGTTVEIVFPVCRPE